MKLNKVCFPGVGNPADRNPSNGGNMSIDESPHLLHPAILIVESFSFIFYLDPIGASWTKVFV